MSHQLGGAGAVLLFGMVYDIFGNYDIGLWAGVISLVIASIASFSISEKEFSSRFIRKFAN
jgi:cyanate permease